MNHTVAEEDLKVISGLLEEWRKTGRLGGLEYDLLLDKIKSLYETVRFGGGQHDESTPCREAASVGSLEPEPSVSAGVFPLEPTEAHTAAYQRPGGTTVRALYDDGEGMARIETVHRYFVTEPVAAENLQGAAEGTDDRAEALPTVPCEADTPDCGSNLSDTRRPVLGEVMGTGVRTFADTLNAPVADVASVLGHEKAGSLRRMIGLNDRYMFIRDLFGGDADAYEEALSRLDGFTSIEDAMLFIHDRYGWNSSSEAALLLSDMLARKLL